MDYNYLINASLDTEAAIQEQKRQEEAERNRLRTQFQAENIINHWKRYYGRKIKTPVIIDITMDFNMSFERKFYYLRLFINGKRLEIYNLEESAGENLTKGVEEESLGGMSRYLLFTNKK